MRWKLMIGAAVLGGAVLAGWFFAGRQTAAPADAGRGGARHAAPVEVAAVERGSLELRRTFSGALEAPAQVIVAPKVSGRVEELTVNLADTVSRGQIVARLDSDEYQQAVAQARAELAVAQANLAEAGSALEIADRQLARATALREQKIISDAELDTARANQVGKVAALAVARAGVSRAEAALAAARIRLGYTEIRADWTEGDATRVVAERLVDEGQTVAANAPLLRIVDIDPITGVVFVTERDYGRLQPGQPVTLTTDAWPGEVFPGRIERIAPVFREATRQARVELQVANPSYRLKPGMFVRATVVLDRVADAVIVPERALTTRGDRTGIFIVSADGTSVRWRPVEVGIREGERVQVRGEGIEGRVVTLGQQLVDDGSPILLPGTKSGGAAGEQSGQ